MFKESKLIEELKREYDEKLKKLRQKEKENKERIYKKNFHQHYLKILNK